MEQRVTVRQLMFGVLVVALALGMIRGVVQDLTVTDLMSVGLYLGPIVIFVLIPASMGLMLWIAVGKGKRPPNMRLVLGIVLGGNVAWVIAIVSTMICLDWFCRF
jgi:hypothetical protein